VRREFGDVLRIHHCFSSEAFTKDKFEYALEKTCNACGLPARLARRGNRGHDITIRDASFSLKTQADAAIKDGYLHISKFMELGQGDWGDKVEDLAGLRTRFFHHMRNYERILTLRRLKLSGFHSYELVEIPKALLLEAGRGELQMAVNSKQFPKPGTCTVKDDKGRMKFLLYFDERKLQVRLIDKNLCVVHATWKFQEDVVSKE
jgi:type II restriction enzyme